MLKGVVIYDDLAHKADSITVSSEETDYPGEHLFDQDPGTLWKPSGQVQADVVFDFGSAVTLTGWAVVNHNVSQGDLDNRNIRLHVGSTDNGSTWDILAAYFNDYWLYMTNPWPIMAVKFSSQTKRYWRVKIYGSATVDYQIGAIVLGTAYAFSDAPGTPYSHELGDGIPVDEDMASYEVPSDEGRITHGLSLAWPYAPTALKEKWDDIHELHEGGMKPLVYIDHHAGYHSAGSEDNGPWPDEGRVHYSTIRALEVKQLSVDERWQIQVRLRDAAPCRSVTS